MERFATAVYKVQKGSFHSQDILEKMAYAVENEQEHAES
jgi:hypothetical protein